MKVQPTTQQLIAMLYERLPELFDRPQRHSLRDVKPLTDEEKRELIKKSELWDMHVHIGWYSAPSKSFVEKAILLIADIEAAHGITKE